MKPIIRRFRHALAFKPTHLQRQFAGRLLCVVAAAPLMGLLFTPILLQAAQVWQD